MEYLILLVIMASQCLTGVFSKFYNKKTGNGSPYVYGGLAALVSALFFLATSKGLNFTTEFLGYSAAFGTAYGTCVIATNLALRYGPIALTSLVTSLSLMIPTLYGIIFLNEPVKIWLVLGLLMLVLSLCLINYQKGDKKISFKWIIFAGLGFFSNGMCSTIQKMEQVAFSGAYKNEFMIAALLMVALVCFIMAIITDRGQITYYVKKGVVFTIGYGIANGLVNLLVMVLGGMMPASLMFPLISALGIIGNYAVGRGIFKEKLTKLQLTGVFVGIISIVFFNL